ncbi:hypothetical protein [Streptomyces mirabilis]
MLEDDTPTAFQESGREPLAHVAGVVLRNRFNSDLVDPGVNWAC